MLAANGYSRGELSTSTKAKTHLSRLVEKAAKGEPFIIAKAGKPLVTVVSLNTPIGAPVWRTSFLFGQFSIPDDRSYGQHGN